MIHFRVPDEPLLDGSLLGLSTFLQENSESLVLLKRGANIFLTLNWLKETFRITNDNLSPASRKRFNKQNWYEYARIITNAASHNLYFKFTEKDKTKLPISYNGETITVEMDNTPWSMKLNTAYSLCEEIIAFVENESSLE